MKRALRIALIAGEHSGDHLGAALMSALRLAEPGIVFEGVGGEAMAREGLTSLFPMEEIAVMGFAPVIARLPTLLRRIRQTAEAVIAARPDALVIIDSPDFTHRVARRVRAAAPAVPIVDYVSPTVWAWRPGRARAMRTYVDAVLALLPFEPAAHARLSGPPCVYVGHPLAARMADFAPDADDLAARAAEPASLVVLPGSRRSEASRLLDVFGRTLALVAASRPIAVTVPAVSTLESAIRDAIAGWPVPVAIVTGEEAKLRAFRRARAALAASGTVTLELALADVPMVGAYRVGWLEAAIGRRMITAHSALLSNLVIGRNAFPERLQEHCTPEALAGLILPLLDETPERADQRVALGEARAALAADGASQAERAAAIVLEHARRGRAAPR